MAFVNRRVLPGFSLSLGYTVFYLTVLVLVPIVACISKASTLTLDQFWAAVWTERTRAAYLLTFGTSLVAAAVNVVLGLLVAWVLVRYRFPGRRLMDSLIDLPLALPTAVGGLVYASLYVKKGWLGQYLVPLGIQAAYTRLAIVLVLVFIGLPFVVRTVQPVLEDLDPEAEEAAASLGAGRWQAFRRVILPPLYPALLTGFALAFARSLGEYGSVVFVSGNMPYKTEIAPVLIVARLQEFAYGEATAIAVVLLAISFAMLVLINLLERWSKRRPRMPEPPLRRMRQAQQDPAWVRWSLILAAVGGRRVDRDPRVHVFAGAFLRRRARLLGQPRRRSRHAPLILLTLTVVPLALAANVVFGIAAAWAIARFRFPGRTVLTALIDLLFSGLACGGGLDAGADLRPAGLPRPLPAPGRLRGHAVPHVAGRGGGLRRRRLPLPAARPAGARDLEEVRQPGPHRGRGGLRGVAGRPALPRRLAARPRRQDHLRHPGTGPRHRLRDVPLRGPRADPGHGGHRRGRRDGGHQPRRERLADVPADHPAQHQVGPGLRDHPLQRARDGRVRRRLRGLRPHRGQTDNALRVEKLFQEYNLPRLSPWHPSSPCSRS